MSLVSAQFIAGFSGAKGRMNTHAQHDARANDVQATAYTRADLNVAPMAAKHLLEYAPGQAPVVTHGGVPVGKTEGEERSFTVACAREDSRGCFEGCHVTCGLVQGGYGKSKGEGGGVVQLQKLMQPQRDPSVGVCDEARCRVQRRESLVDHEGAARGREGPARENASDAVHVVNSRGCSDVHSGEMLQNAARTMGEGGGGDGGGVGGGGRRAAGDEGDGGCGSALNEL